MNASNRESSETHAHREQGASFEPTQPAAANTVESVAESLSAEIERLAVEMQKTKRRGPLNVKTVQQLDALTELLQRQRSELLEQADNANDVLEECQDELQRANYNVRAVARLREMQAADRDRRNQRRDAA